MLDVQGWISSGGGIFLFTARRPMQPHFKDTEGIAAGAQDMKLFWDFTCSCRPNTFKGLPQPPYS